MRLFYRRVMLVVAAVVLTAAFSYVPARAAGAGGGEKQGNSLFTGASAGQFDQDEPKAVLSEAEKKLDSQLLQLVKPEMTAKNVGVGLTAKYFTGESGLNLESAESVDTVCVYVTMAPGADFVTLNGAVQNVTNTDRSSNLAVAKVGVEQLGALAALPEVKSVRMVMPPVVYEGSYMSQGDALLKADQLRDQLGADGTGIKVGIISDGADSIEAAQASNDLPDPDDPGDPGSVTILRNAVGGDEGTAMMEIVHDLAPNADIYFHDCGNNVLEFCDAIDSLIAAGCTVVCDDIGWLAEPYFEDGFVASHIAGIVAENNVVYATSAGNAADSHYQGLFVEAGTTGRHNKDLYIDLPPGEEVTVILQWDDPFGTSSNDYDLYLGARDHSDWYVRSYYEQSGYGCDPFEGFIVENTGTSIISCAIWVEKYSGVARNLELYVYPGPDAELESTNIVAADSIFGHAAVPGVLTCAAINANPSDGLPDNQVEYFSSRGPVTMLEGVTRQKPDISGADGVSVTGAGGFPNPFYGTSAASPHIAAVAALLWDFYPDYSADEIRGLITDNAADMGAAGFDTAYGWGKADSQASALSVIEYVTFDSQGGSAVPQAMTHIGGKISAPSPAPTKDGYGFFGWYKEAACVNPWNFAVDVVTENITLYAKWRLGPYTVTFDPQGGTSVNPATAYDGDLIAAPTPAPTRTGYTFEGWYTEAACENAWVFETNTVTGSITLYAKWTPIVYTVTFSAIGGTPETSTISAAYGTTISPPDPQPARTGYTFAGWYKESSYAHVWDFDTDTVTANRTLWARWTINIYTVTFDSQGGSAVAGRQVNYNATFAAPTSPTKTGCTFRGWYKESDCLNVWSFTSDRVPAEDITLYAKWTPNTYRAYFDSLGGSAVAYANVVYDTPVPAPTPPTRTGYKFEGWYKESSYVNAWDFENDRMPGRNMTLYAKWSRNNYIVTFDSRGGSEVDGKVAAYYSLIPAPLIPVREHYTFKGWYKDIACRYAWSFSKERIPARDVTIYAKWSAHTFTVSFNSQGGTRVYGKTAGYNSRISAPRSPRRTGYAFAGWYKEAECLTPWDFGVDTVLGKTTLYAKWNINHYTVKYDARDGTLTGPATDIVEYRSLLGIPEPPTKPDCAFGGWYTSSRYFTDKYKYNFASGRVTKSFTLYAKWMPSQYKVTFNTMGGTPTIESQEVPWNGFATAPEEDATKKDGYLLEGWYTSSRYFTSSYKWNFETRAVTGSVTLYARWLPEQYKVTFNANGGTLADGSTVWPASVYYNTLAAKPADPARAGYYFGGWYTSSRYFTSKYEWNFDTRTVKSNVTLYARWVRTLSTPKVTAVATADDTVLVTCSTVQYATGYRFLYADSTAGPWTQVDSAAPSIAAGGLDAGKTYCFKAQAVNEEGGVTSAMSSVVTEISGKPASPAAAAATYNKITVTWDAVPRCTGYEVWRATSSRGTYYRKGYVGVVSVPSFDNTSVNTGTTYYYKVKAYRMVGTKKVYGAYSAVVSAKCTLGVPASFGAVSGADAKSIRLSWDAVPGVTRYEVWRATADKGVYYRLTTTPYTYCTNSKLVTGQPYYYKVRAYRIVSGRKVYGAFTPVVIATPGTTP